MWTSVSWFPSDFLLCWLLIHHLLGSDLQFHVLHDFIPVSLPWTSWLCSFVNHCHWLLHCHCHTMLYPFDMFKPSQSTILDLYWLIPFLQFLHSVTFFLPLNVHQYVHEVICSCKVRADKRLGDPPQGIQQPVMVRDSNGRPQEDPWRCTASVCSNSALLGISLG